MESFWIPGLNLSYMCSSISDAINALCIVFQMYNQWWIDPDCSAKQTLSEL